MNEYPRRRDLRNRPTGNILPRKSHRRMHTVALFVLTFFFFAGCTAFAAKGIKTASPAAPSVAEQFEVFPQETVKAADAVKAAEAVEPVGDVAPEEATQVLDSETTEDILGVVPTPVPAGDGDITGVPGSSGRLDSMPSRAVTRSSMGPNRLFIPSAAVYAKVRPGAVTNNQLDIPRSPSQVGVWSGGVPAVSSAVAGNTVMSGHVNYSGVRGALWNLSTLRKGTVAYTTDSAGNAARWKLVALTQVKKTALPDFVFDTEGTRRLVIVTCGGVVRDHHYTDNVIATFVPA